MESVLSREGCDITLISPVVIPERAQVVFVLEIKCKEWLYKNHCKDYHKAIHKDIIDVCFSSKNEDSNKAITCRNNNAQLIKCKGTKPPYHSFYIQNRIGLPSKISHLTYYCKQQ